MNVPPRCRGSGEPGTDTRLNAVVLSHFKGGFNYAQTQKAPYGITKPGEATKVIRNAARRRITLRFDGPARARAPGTVSIRVLVLPGLEIARTVS